MTLRQHLKDGIKRATEAAAESAVPISHTRYISSSRASLINWDHLTYAHPQAACGECLGKIYSPVTDTFCEYIRVADDDPRAETVVSHAIYDSDAEFRGEQEPRS